MDHYFIYYRDEIAAPRPTLVSWSFHITGRIFHHVYLCFVERALAVRALKDLDYGDAASGYGVVATGELTDAYDYNFNVTPVVLVDSESELTALRRAEFPFDDRSYWYSLDGTLRKDKD